MKVEINKNKISQNPPLSYTNKSIRLSRGVIPVFRGVDKFVPSFENPVPISEAITHVLSAIASGNLDKPIQKSFLNPDPALMSFDKLCLVAKKIGSKINLEVIYSHPKADGSIPVIRDSSDKVSKKLLSEGFMDDFNAKLSNAYNKIYFNKTSRFED